MDEGLPVLDMRVPIPYRCFLVSYAATLIVATCYPQDQVRPAGGAPPTLENVMEIPSEWDFKLPKGTDLPDSVDLSPWFPPAGDQFKQASCSGWALGYALSTYHWNRRLGQKADTTYLADPANVFSPSFVYNLTALRESNADCRVGVQLSEAIELVCDTGCATWMQYPYDTATVNCLRHVPDSVLTSAFRHRMSEPLGIDNRNYEQWRYYLSQGKPVVFLASISFPFFQKGFAGGGKVTFTWDEPVPTDWNGREGHIMVCTGYQDSTFLVLNSWGTGWGKRGYMRVPFKTMYWACSEAYVMKPGPAPPPTPVPVKEDAHVLDKHGKTHGGLKRGEMHASDGILFWDMGPTQDRNQRMIEFLDEATRERICTLTMTKDRTRTFHHKGSLYTFTCTGQGWLFKRFRYTLEKLNSQEQNDFQKRLESQAEQNFRGLGK